MGGGILILIIILIVWAVKTGKENMAAAQFRSDTKGMSVEEMCHYSRCKELEKCGCPTVSYQEYKRANEERLFRKIEEETRERIEFLERTIKESERIRNYKQDSE